MESDHKPEKEPVQYALQIQVNPGRPSAYWKFDDETEPSDDLEEVRGGLMAALADGYATSDLRVVGVHVIDVCRRCDDTNRRCKAIACRERQDDRHTLWWCEWGCCSRAHAIDYYGEEIVDV